MNCQQEVRRNRGRGERSSGAIGRREVLGSLGLAIAGAAALAQNP